MPPDAAEGILRGMYRFRTREAGTDGLRVQLFGSGPILREVLRAQDILAERYQVSSDVWSVTSYKRLRSDALAAERWNMLHPGEPPRTCHLWDRRRGIEGPFVAASDYGRLVAEQIARWVPGDYVTLGTDGFGRSDTREALRRFFEVDAESITVAALSALARRGEKTETGGRIEPRITREAVKRAALELGIDPDKPDPATT